MEFLTAGREKVPREDWIHRHGGSGCPELRGTVMKRIKR